MTSFVAPDETGRILARALVGMLPDDGGVACVVGTCGREDPDAFQEIAAECETTDTPFFLVELGAATLRLSPVYGRAHGSCYHCRAETLRAARGPFDHAVPVPAGWLPQHLDFVAKAVAEVIVRLPHTDPVFRSHRMLDLFDSTLSSAPSEGIVHA